jgi:hypothetical protein
MVDKVARRCSVLRRNFEEKAATEKVWQLCNTYTLREWVRAVVSVQPVT